MARPPTDTRDRILVAARDLFGKKGVDATSIRAIARAARVNLAMIHYFFGSKDNLVDAVLEAYYAQIGHALAAVPEAGQPRERLEAAIHAIVRYIQANQSVVRIVVREYTLQTPRLRRIVEKFLRPNFARLATTLAEGVGSGEFRALDVRYLAMAVLGMVMYPFVARPLLSQFLELDFETPAFAEGLAGTVLTLLFDGLLPPKPRARPALVERPTRRPR
ncbi:MAG: TetR/AcrR family transcriptional regulator [Planctomycetes bacterium]|nr:TetR/AcrR family transcriptional regulator [Planctomycetota bacterium]